MADKIEDAGAGLWEPVRPAEPTRREPRASAPEPSSDSVPSDVRSLFVAPVDSGPLQQVAGQAPSAPAAPPPTTTPAAPVPGPKTPVIQYPAAQPGPINGQFSTSPAMPMPDPTNLRIVEGRFRIHELAFRSLFRIRSLFRTCSLFRIRSPARRRNAMARMQFRGKKAFLGFVIMSQMFAPIVLLVGISQLMNALRLNDSIWGLMLINAAFNQAFAIWLLRGTFVSISSEMEQAASIDGCNTVSALLRVLLPMAAPGIVTTLIFVFINAWNEYTISTVLISTPFLKPITVGITQFSSFNMIEWQYLFASALLATIPVVVLFMFIEKHLVAGLTSGGVKG